MGVRGDNPSVVQQSAYFLKLDWKRLSFFSLIFFIVLILDVIVIAYFMLNFYYVTEDSPNEGFCLYDSYVEYLKTDIPSEDPMLCDSFFSDSENYKRCGTFGGLQDYCRYVFVYNELVFPECEDFTEPEFIDKCNIISFQYVDIEVFEEELIFQELGIENFGGENNEL